MVPANIAGLNPRTIYAKKTIDGRGAPREVDDTSKPIGYMVNNGDGTYSNYTIDGAVESTYVAPSGFFGELSRNATSVANDTSGVIGKFVVPALAMGYGASLINGAGAAGAVGEGVGAAAAEAGGAGGGSAFSLQGGTGTLGSASQTSTLNAMATGGLGATAPVATTGATFGASSAAATTAALGGTTLASSLTPTAVGGWSLGKTASTLNGAAKIAKDPKGALTDMALDLIPGGKDIKDILSIATATKYLTGGGNTNTTGGGNTNTTGGNTDTGTGNGNVISRLGGTANYDSAGFGRAIREGVKNKYGG